MRWLLLLILLLTAAAPGWAQSNPGWPTGYIPSAAQWAQAFGGKRDYSASIPACTWIPCQPATPLASGVLQWGSGGLAFSTALPSGLTLPNATLTGTVTFGTLNLSTPLPAISGGSGLASPASHAVLLGEGGQPFNAVAPGMSGQVLISQGATDPAFEPISGDLTIASTGLAALAAANSGAGSCTLCSLSYDVKGRVTTAAIGSLASPPAIGLTTPNAAAFSTMLAGTNSASNNYIANNIGSTTTTAQIVGLSTPGGGYGMLGGCELASGPSTTDCFGVGGFALINGSAATQTGWSMFGQTRHISTNGISLAAELNPVNISNTAPSPAYPYGIVGNYTSQPFVASNWSSCGDPNNFLPGQVIGDCSVAYGILNNAASPAVTGSNRATGGAFLDGIVFSNDAIRGTTGADADAFPVNAIGLARMQGISFYNSGDTSANAPANRIYGATTSAVPSGVNVRFDNVGFVVENASDKTWQMAIRPVASATDYLLINGGTSSMPVGIGIASARSSAGINLVANTTGNIGIFSGATLDGYFAPGFFTYPTPLPTGTPATYACFTSSGQLISSAAAC